MAAFHISWDDLQVFIPNPLVPGQFFIGNSAGRDQFRRRVRTARPAGSLGVDLFGGAGFTHARSLGRQLLQRRRRQRQNAVEHAELHGGLRRPVSRVRCAKVCR